MALAPLTREVEVKGEALEFRTVQTIHLWDKAPPEGKEWMEGAHLHYRAQFQPLEDNKAQPEGIADLIHRKTDRMIKELMRKPGAKNVSCKKGCNACCHQIVRITMEEAALLRYGAEKLGVWIDGERLERQAVAGSVEAWGELPHEDKRCVFLKGGVCSVYQYRPAACRKYLVQSDPLDCDMEKRPGARTKLYASWEAEVLYSAALSVFDSDSLARALIRLGKGEGN